VEIKAKKRVAIRPNRAVKEGSEKRKRQAGASPGGRAKAIISITKKGGEQRQGPERMGEKAEVVRS